MSTAQAANCAIGKLAARLRVALRVPSGASLDAPAGAKNAL